MEDGFCSLEQADLIQLNLEKNFENVIKSMKLLVKDYQMIMIMKRIYPKKIIQLMRIILIKFLKINQFQMNQQKLSHQNLIQIFHHQLIKSHHQNQIYHQVKLNQHHHHHSPKTSLISN